MKKYTFLGIFIILLGVGGLTLAATTTKTPVKAPAKTTKTVVKTPVKKTTTVATKFDYEAWIPYWRKTEGAANATANLDKLTQISPFNYELKLDGSNIIDDAGVINEEPWVSLIAQAKKKGVKVYPTILAYPHNDTEKNNLYLLLAQRESRNAHIQDIMETVTMNNFDGIDIDYEAKTAETRDYFSDFLTKLGTELHKKNKQLICTIEARTPPESKFATTSPEVLQKIEYSNDYKAIGAACDQVRIMMYDQMNDDQVLVNANSAQGNLYMPVADIEWIKKVATLALWDIPAKKIIMGVPTYGYKYEITPATATNRAKYSRIGSMNWNYADELAKSIGVTPIRNSAGELSFTYATSTGVNGEDLGGIKQYLIWYSDAQAIADKIKIAKLYGLGGIAIFKIDGGFDPKLWSVLK
ncbi:MAG: peptidoglycan-binding protein [Candidatus Nomurabacteria bacterium]|nr:peptidoglycan-binding protein [Candidatus Nomurabacteria bacterium]